MSKYVYMYSVNPHNPNPTLQVDGGVYYTPGVGPREMTLPVLLALLVPDNCSRPSVRPRGLTLCPKHTSGDVGTTHLMRRETPDVPLQCQANEEVPATPAP